MTTTPRPVKYAHGKHPNTIAGLRPFQYKPGTNGHGRVYPLKERLQHALDHPLKEPKPDAPHGDVIVFNTLKGAAELVPVAFKETWDRVEGKVPDQLNIKALMIQVGDDYAKEGLEAIRREIAEREARLRLEGGEGNATK